MLLCAAFLVTSALAGVMACVGDTPDSSTSTDGGASSSSGGSSGASGGPNDGGGGSDTGAGDSGGPPCDLSKAFVTPEDPLVSLNLEKDNASPAVTANEREIFFQRQNNDGGVWDLYSATRGSVTEVFGYGNPINELSTPITEAEPGLSADGNTLYFVRGATEPEFDIYRATRADGGWSPGTALPSPVNAPDAGERAPFGTSDGLWFAARVAGKLEIFFAPASSGGFSTPSTPSALVGPTSDDSHPVLTENGTRIYFSSDRNGTSLTDIWTATRSAPGANFGNPTRVDELATDREEEPGSASPDGCRLYFTRRESGSNQFKLYVAHKPPAK